MDEKITLELEKDEIILLQELVEEIEPGYQWRGDIAASLRKKVQAAYKKPVISREEYERQLNEMRRLFKGEPCEELIVHAEKIKIRFYNNVEEEAHEA